MVVPHGPIEDNERAGWTTSQHLTVVVGLKIRDGVLWHARPVMRPRHEAGCAILRPEIIDHQDEAQKGPIGGVARNIDVQLSAARMRLDRPRMQRTEFERPPNDAAARI